MSTSSTGPQSEESRRHGFAQDRPVQKDGFLASIKGPLIFSFVLAIIGGVVAMLTASGGTDNPVRVDIGLIAFGVFFIVSLVVVAMLQLAAKDNPEHLSQGSGMHRSSEELHQESVARRKAHRQREEAARGRRPDAPTNGDSDGTSGSDPVGTPGGGTATDGKMNEAAESNPHGVGDTPGQSTR